ncbi:hypothetical protein IA57_01930 [Mangrovimonas yunxiaonensis]|uniref:DUF2141 domain-containing protein n=1 Tax=Mangrovimonas yunxiaonensis TaxID=1197477 RepID=A0A084TNX9_9FLAO|nr:DUF2141 domain-containing protein [Mangrovimonas yunxiaonensis]KFB02415.1 hypothetical protein IA57_01930 [Mangrovimonas yunxiaonensis]GGH40192.1 hypothetical protein GCM10011364_10140 [Mangrovimonas yunxiaonensis]
MKTLAIVLTTLLTSFFCTSQTLPYTTKTYTVTIKIANVLNAKGHILIGLHNQNTFMKTKGIQNVKLKAEGDTVLATLPNLKPGSYAIMVLHDQNDNNRMDFDTSGMPLEPYGMSNNPMLFGPPTFHDAQFEITNKNLEVTIRF